MKLLSTRICLPVLLCWLAVPHGLAQAAPDFDTQIQQGSAELQAGSAARALESADAAIRINPDRWDGYALAGRALLSLKRYEAAADAISQAIERAPGAQQGTLRALRRQSLLAESPALAPPAAAQTDRAAAPRAESPPAPGREAVWTDPDTRLIWARPGYYPPEAQGPWDYREAASFCASLRLLGYSSWRLPTADELRKVYRVSSKGWRWSSPQFSPGYGIDGWKLADFTVAGDTFNGNRILMWSSTPGNQAGRHQGVYFGRPYSVADGLRAGVSLGEEKWRNPFQGYALCVRTEAAQVASP